MRAQSAGSAAVLMFVFLVVIAVVGVFGIPQFAPVAASPSVGDDGWTSDEFNPLQEVGLDQVFVQGAEDLFAPVETNPVNPPGAEDDPFPLLDHELLERQAQTDDRLTDLRDASTELPGEALDGWTYQSQHSGTSFAESRSKRNLPHSHRRSSATLADRPPAKLKLLAFGERSTALDDNAQSISRPFDDVAVAPTENSLAPGTDNSARQLESPSVLRATADRLTRSHSVVSKATSREHSKPMTWRSAVGRLNSLGIRDYRLSPGERPREFHFSCFFTPADNPRITHRFEAEAIEPLDAVKKVLAQIDDWLDKR